MVRLFSLKSQNHTRKVLLHELADSAEPRDEAKRYPSGGFAQTHNAAATSSAGLLPPAGCS